MEDPVDDEESSTTATVLEDLVETLSQPERNLLPWLHDSSSASNGADKNINNTSKKKKKEGIVIDRSVLLQTCQTLFQEIEQLGNLYRSVVEQKSSQTKDNHNNEKHTTHETSLSGLSELYFDSSSPSSSAIVDAETVWGQVDLQNDALVTLLKKSIKRLSKSHRDICVLEMKEVLSSSDEDDDAEKDENEEEVEEEHGSDGSDDDDDDDNTDEDDETRRIRERMERAEQEMEDSEDDDDDDDENAGDTKDLKSSTEKDSDGESLVDPAAEELNDGFFDITEMEEFADEEEDFLPDLAFGQPETQTKKNNKKKNSLEQPKSFHQRQREGADMDIKSDDDDDDDDEENDDEFDFDEEPVRRKKYRDDEDIDALYTLYQDAGSDEDGDDEDDDEIVNMTAADFFGKPNKKHFYKHPSQAKGNKKSMPIRKKGKHNNNNQDESWGDDTEVSKDRHIGWADQMDDGGDGLDEPMGHDDEEEEVTSDTKQNKNSRDTSNHAKKVDKLQRQTEQIEKEMLAEKPWQMTGESKSTSRPVNSLLEGTPEFNVASKMAPTITIEQTASLEEIIKQRILSEEWDDVIPRELPDVGWHKDRGELPEVSQEKSKLGLGELYEREYLKKAVGFDKDATEKQSVEDIAKNEMKQLFANVCSKLDALSNYHFAPRPVSDEAEVRPVSTPAIAMEEVLPLHVSDARGVAPEEVYRTKRGRDGVLRNETELDQTDRKRQRSSKKATRRKARKEKLADEKLISRLEPGLGLNNPYEKRKMREELSVARARGKVTTGEQDMQSTKFGSSGTFFKRLQSEAQDSIRATDADNGDDNNGNKGSKKPKSSAFKL